MQFGEIPIARLDGCVLGHNVIDAAGRRVLRKGTRLSADHVERLRALGHETVWAARLDADDVDEDAAAARVSRAAAGAGIELVGPRTGRVNLRAEHLGVVRIDAERLAAVNRCAGITLATLAGASVAEAGRIVGTTKVIPYAVPEEAVRRAEGAESDARPAIWLDPLGPRRVSLVVSAPTTIAAKTLESFATALGERLRRLGSELGPTLGVPPSPGGVDRLAEALRERGAAGDELIVLAGSTAIQDRDDLAPAALVRAGGRVTAFGAPVDPGNLVLVGELGDAAVLGAPGCARSRKRNIVDLLLPRMLVGERLGQEEIATLAAGGLLEDVPERPLPRSRL